MINQRILGGRYFLGKAHPEKMNEQKQTMGWALVFEPIAGNRSIISNGDRNFVLQFFFGIACDNIPLCAPLGVSICVCARVCDNSLVLCTSRIWRLSMSACRMLYGKDWNLLDTFTDTVWYCINYSYTFSYGNGMMLTRHLKDWFLRRSISVSPHSLYNMHCWKSLINSFATPVHISQCEFCNIVDLSWPQDHRIIIVRFPLLTTCANYAHDLLGDPCSTSFPCKPPLVQGSPC